MIIPISHRQQPLPDLTGGLYALLVEVDLGFVAEEPDELPVPPSHFICKSFNFPALERGTGGGGGKGRSTGFLG